MGDGRRYRVVQWATGNIGTYALRAVIDHPQYELAGVYVYSDDKAGRDAGELCGVGATGVLATRSVDEILALGADCVLYMPAACDIDDVCRLLASGANIVTTRGEFGRAANMDPAERGRVQAAADQGASSIHSTGSSPGFISEAVPFALTSIQRRLDGLLIEEFADLASRDSPDLLFGVMGFGSPPDSFDEARWTYGAAAFGPSLQVLADALSLPLDSVEGTGAVATATAPVEMAAGRLEPGTVAAQRMIVTGHRHGAPLLRFVATWYCTNQLDPAWSVRETGWHLVVDGDAPLDVDIRFPVPPERYASVSPAYTANRAVNAVPFVCAAAPGIRSSVDLPQFIPSLG
jgi:4-hydroxy-tetrahydrodipicolinate reductase